MDRPETRTFDSWWPASFEKVKYPAKSPPLTFHTLITLCISNAYLDKYSIACNIQFPRACMNFTCFGYSDLGEILHILLIGYPSNNVFVWTLIIIPYNLKLVCLECLVGVMVGLSSPRKVENHWRRKHNNPHLTKCLLYFTVQPSSK